jgi:hypothetical protein
MILTDLLLLMIGLRATPCISYTSFNIFSILYAFAMRKDALLPTLFVNSLALHSSFYSVNYIFDRDFFCRLRISLGVTKPLFIAGDIVFHWLPTIMFIILAIRKRIPYNPYAGLESLLLNMLWAQFNTTTFDLSSIYTPLTKWHNVWWVCAFWHAFFGYMLSLF